jgi:DNA-binding LytR/AlgR family response regulator
MNLRQSVPDYITTKKNTIIQIAFTTVFAYIFINIYRPFGYNNWYKIQEWKLMIASAVVVLTGMIIIILSRLVLLHLKKTHEITYGVFIWFVTAEIILMGAFYTSLEVFILHDTRSPFNLMFNAIQNTSLILLIPYTLSFLFFAWTDIKKKFDQMLHQFRDPSDIFIPFKDEKGNLKITIKCSNVLYLESNDNYVNIHYTDNGKRKTYMIRSSLKQYESELESYPVYRNHRKFSINIKNVKLLIKEKKGFELVINSEQEEKIPVSRSYEKVILDLINNPSTRPTLS